MKRINFLVLMVCCLFLGTNFVKAQEAPIYFVNQDFESSTDVPWTFGGANAGDYGKTIEDKGAPYNKVLQLVLNNQRGSRTMNTPFSNVSVPTDGILYLEFDWNLGTPTNRNTSGIFFRFKDSSDSTSIAFSVASNNGSAGNALHLVNLDDTITTQATAATTLLVPTGGNFVRSTWVSISAKLNFNTDKIESLTVTNGTATYTGADIDFYSDDVSGLDLLEIYANRDGSNMGWTGLVDNFKIYKNVPVAQLAKLTVDYRIADNTLVKSVDAGYFEVGSSYTLDKAPFAEGGKNYVCLSDNSGTENGVIAFASAGEQTITVVVKEPIPAVGNLTWNGTEESNAWNMLAENFLDEESGNFEYQVNKDAIFGANGYKTVSVSSDLDMGTGNVIVSADGYSFAGATLNGTGKMTVNGSTTLELPFRLSGGIDLQSGTLEVKNIANAPLTVAAGTELNVNTDADFSNAISGAGTFTLIPTTNNTYTSAVTGVETMVYKLVSAGSVKASGGEFSGMPCLNNVYSGNISVTTELEEAWFGSTLASFQSINLGKGVSMVYPTNPASNGSTAVTIAKFSGDAGSKVKGTRIGRTVSYTFGDATDAVYAGTFENFGPDQWNGVGLLNVTKVGTGTLTLSGISDSYTNGTVAVNAGTLNLVGATLGSSAGNVPVTVASAAILEMSSAVIAGTATINGSLQVDGKTIVGTAADAPALRAAQALSPSHIGTLVIPANQPINLLTGEQLTADSVAILGATTLNFAAGMDVDQYVGMTLAEIIADYFGTETAVKVEVIGGSVTVTDADDRTFYMDADQVLTFTPTISKPTVADIACDGFTLNWEADVDNFVVKVYQGETLVHESEALEATTYQVTGLSASTLYNATITASNGITSATSEKAEALTIKCFDGDLLIWTGEVSDEWNNAANWNEGSVPDGDIKVEIPSNAKTFPVLKEEDNASAKAITLSPGAQLGNQHLLECDSAYVSLAFNEANLATGTWHMLSMPINEVYTGDFSFGGHPYTYLRKFEIQGDEETTIADWTKEYQANDIDLPIGVGFMFMVNEKGNTFGSKYSGKGTDQLVSNEERLYGLDQLEGVMTFPYYEDKAMSDARRVHKYDAEKKESTIYSYDYKGLLEVNPAPATLKRTENSYKLFEGATLTREVEFAKDANNEKYFALVGNPFVTAIDMGALYAANNAEGENFKNSYTVWTGTGFTTYGPVASFGAVQKTPALTSTIAPFQSFLIEKGTDYAGEFDMVFDNEVIGATNAEGVELRSASAKAGNMLTIQASTPEAAYTVFVAKRDNGSDKLANADGRIVLAAANDAPQIYTLKPSVNGGKVGLGANIINNDNMLIPVSLLTTHTGKMSFSIDGMNDYPTAKVYFLDTATGREEEITGMASYTYDFDYTGSNEVTENRFFIRLAPQATTDLDEAASDAAYAYAEDGQIKVVATDLSAVYVYNQQGQSVSEAINLDGVSYATDQLTIGEIYLVRIVTEAGVKTQKVLVK